jgi:hypothetical protein
MLGNLLGVEAPRQIEDIDTKRPRVSPWDIIDAINTHNTELVTEDNEAQCKKEAYYVFRALSMGADTVILANEMNARYHLDLCEYYGYSMAKARQVLPLLTLDQLLLIKQRLNKGGT